MNNDKNFEDLKKQMIDENEKKYGQEIREKYGTDTIEASNKKFGNMSKEQWENAEALSILVNETIKEACLSGDPAGETAQKACDLHRQWLCMFWEDGKYSKEAHLNLAQIYCDDERFKKYYEAITPGAAEFLLDAMKIYCVE